MSCVIWARLKFNVMPDEELEKGFRVGWLQFNDMPVEYKERGLLWAVYRNG
jgi:hypothetical protein